MLKRLHAGHEVVDFVVSELVVLDQMLLVGIAILVGDPLNYLHVWSLRVLLMTRVAVARLVRGD